MADDPKPDEVTDDPNPAVDDPKPETSSEPDWKAESRKHEKRAKQERKDREALEARLRELEDAGKDEKEKAIEQARREGRDEALTEAQKERRADRLEVSVTRLAAKGVKVGDGDDAETVRFADPEDALLIVEREIARGDLDEDEIFDREGKVQTDALTTALANLLERKPHLRADAAGGGGPRPSGDADAGKGKGPKAEDDLSVDEHLAAVQGRK